MTDPVLPRIYLDNAATSFPKPECVYAAVSDFMVRNGAAFGRGSYADGNSSVQIVTECRQKIARLIGATSEEVAFTFNCTDSLNLLLRGFLKPGDRVVTTTLEHNSVLRPLSQLQSEFDLQVKYVDPNSSTGIIDLAELERVLSETTTQLVVLNHASNVTGVIQPVSEAARLAHQFGARILLDGAQTVGHLPFSVVQSDVDFLATAGHKGLLGPLGTGVVYVRSELIEMIRPVRCGGTGTFSESLEQPRDMSGLFESGNLNMPGLAGLNAAAEWLLSQDSGELHRRVDGLASGLRQSISALNVATVHGDSESPNTGIVSFVIDGLDSREAAVILDSSFGVQCRAGFHCAPLVHEKLATSESGGSIRLSPGVFTTQNDIDAAVRAVEQLCDVFST